jgi:hypothetical protein
VENYSEIVQELISSYSAVECNMSLKLHLLHSHLDFFPENMEAVSNERGEKFIQDTSQTEKRYSGKCNPNMLVDYSWNLARETSISEYRDPVHYFTVYITIKNNTLLYFYYIVFKFNSFP